MIVKQIKLSNAAKDKLARLKGKTGIQNWNVLCRWALCYSLKEGTIPTDIEIASDSNVEMSWLIFAGEYHEIYEALIKDLELLDVETRKNIRASNKKERFLRRFGVLSIGDLVVEFFELLFNIVFNITMVFADVLLCLLAIFFPLVVAFSIVPSWKGSLMQWFGKYIEISMWKPVAAGICYIIGTAQSAVRIGAIKSLDGAQSAAASFSGSQFGVAIASLLIVYAGIKCFWKVPSIATTIFNLGGGALSDFGSMAGAAAMSGAQALGKAAKTATSPATGAAGGALAGAIAGVGAGTGAATGAGKAIGQMLGMQGHSGTGFKGAMKQIFAGEGSDKPGERRRQDRQVPLPLP